MLNRFLYILLFCVCFFAGINSLFSQGSSVSPYSAYGIGDLYPKASIRQVGMANVGIGLSDATSLNLSNPASYSEIQLTCFDFSGYFSLVSQQSNTKSITQYSGGLNSLAFAFPTRKKFCLSMGFTPYSVTGYHFRQVETRYLDTIQFTNNLFRQADGGLNRAFLGSGIRLTKNLSIGPELAFLFGTTNYYYSSAQTLSNSAAVEFQNRIYANGFLGRLGVLWKDSINDKHRYSIGLISELTSKLTAENRLINYYVSDTVSLISGKITIPMLLGLGFGLSGKSYRLGLDVSWQDWGKFKYLSRQDNLGQKWDVRIGGEWFPTSNSGYLSKVDYRAGMFFEQGYLNLRDYRLIHTGFSIGAGFPMPRSFSRIHLGLVFGTRGTTQHQLLKENYLKIYLGVSFVDRWFIKRKID